MKFKISDILSFLFGLLAIGVHLFVPEIKSPTGVFENVVDVLHENIIFLSIAFLGFGSYRSKKALAKPYANVELYLAELMLAVVLFQIVLRLL